MNYNGESQGNVDTAKFIVLLPNIHPHDYRCCHRTVHANKFFGDSILHS